ncbi:hypothetical protein [Kytococcus sedentarius]|uniref:hypothetical protein n=1 Tax=Kytococcus sedentarius TaxID=1276 RepID=UPI0035BBABA5
MLELLAALIGRITGWSFVGRQLYRLTRPPATDDTARQLLEDLQEAEAFNNPHEQKIYHHLRKVAEERAMASRLSYASTPPSSIARAALTWCVISLISLLVAGAFWAASIIHEPLNEWRDLARAATGIVTLLASFPTLLLLFLGLRASSRQAHKKHRSEVISAFLRSKGMADPGDKVDNSPLDISAMDLKGLGCTPGIASTAFSARRWPTKDLGYQNRFTG